MKAQFFCLALVIVLLSPTSPAQWVQTNGPNGGGKVLAVTPASSGSGNNVFASTGGGLFLSTDNGTTWTPVNKGLSKPYIECFAVSGSNLFVGTPGIVGISCDSLFLSTNNGASWEAIGVSPDTIIHHLAASSNGIGGTNLYAVASANGMLPVIYLTSNNGATWTPIGLMPEYVSSVAVVPTRGGTGTNLLAGTNTSGIFLSTNNGASWSAVNEGLPKGIKAWDSTRYYGVSWFESIGQNLYAGTGGGGIFLSTNGGTSWRAINDGLPKYTHSYDSHLYIPVSCIASSGENLFAGVRDVGLYVSTNNGTNWKPLSTTGLTTTSINSLAIASNGSGSMTLITGTSVGVFISTDNGTRWISTGFKTSDVYTLAASPTNGGQGTNLFAGTSYGGVSLSTNNGSTWSSGTDFQVRFRSLVASPNGSGGTNLFGVLEEGSALYRSTDNGASWVAVKELPSGTYGYGVRAVTVALNRRGSPTLFASGGGRIFSSTDFGNSWAAVGVLPSDNRGGAACFTSYPAAGGYGINVFCGLGVGEVFLSTDNGMSWNAFNSRLTSAVLLTLAVSPTDGGSGTNLFAGTSSGVFLTTNNGASWTAAGLEGTAVLDFAVSPAINGSGTNILAATSTGVFLSSNNGTNWTAVNSGLTNTDVRALLISGTDLYAATHGAGVWRRPLSEIVTAVDEKHNQIPSTFALAQNYPNPFNPSTIITYELPKSSHVNLSVYNMLGMEVATLVNDNKAAGVHTVQFNGSGLASGVYFYRLETAGFVQTRKLVLVK